MAMPKQESYLVFVLQESDGKRLTDRWHVANRNNASQLGLVTWHAPWRRFTYQPSGPQVLDAMCMREIAGFCEDQTSRQQRLAKARREQEPAIV